MSQAQFYNDPELQQLLYYLAQLSENQSSPIAHPDQSVNLLMSGPGHKLRKASVLIPIIKPEANKPAAVILTVRSKHLRNHAGQIAFPGGSKDKGDIDAIATALRESEEEIGLKPEFVEVLGKLGDIALPSGFCVTPVVGLIEPGLEYVLCPIEVDQVFEVPLALLLDPASYSSSTMTYKKKPRQVLEIFHQEYRIWGATAAILHHLAVEVIAAGNQS